ncbi:MAG: dTDP-4-dehydrorhamnose reductase [Acidobacteria bacterium]|nr:MAG: dTDP-4-dehydrorhamnose reductase [Acidobacteriota bacterium]
MRILVTGAAGMLGHALVPVLKEDHEVAALAREDCDLCDRDNVQELFRLQKPEMVVHLAAFTNVDGCELDPEKAKSWNELATLNVAMAAKHIGAAVLYTSTDYIFDGRATSPYSEDAPPSPLSVYGRTKLMGERHVREIVENYFIVRTSWLYGTDGKNFVSTILRLAREKPELRVVNDQRGSPTYTNHLAEKLAELVVTREYGIYHVTARGSCTWYEFARKILELCSLQGIHLVPISTSECGRPAARPAYSVLENRRLSSLGIGLLPDWEEGLRSYLAEIGGGGKCADKVIEKQPACSRLA